MLPGFVSSQDCRRLLPAPAASTAISAITAVPAASAATPASTTRPATAASTRSSATASAVASAPASTAARPATTAATFPGRASFVNDNIAAHEIVAIESLHGAVGFFVVVNLDKPEPARLTRETVAHQRDICRGDSRLRE